MEVNVDLLDQMELIDISEQEALDVFFSSGGEEGVLTSPLPGMENRKLRDYKTHCMITPDNVLYLTHSPRKQQPRGGHQQWTLSTCP